MKSKKSHLSIDRDSLEVKPQLKDVISRRWGRPEVTDLREGSIVSVLLGRPAAAAAQTADVQLQPYGRISVLEERMRISSLWPFFHFGMYLPQRVKLVASQQSRQ